MPSSQDRQVRLGDTVLNLRFSLKAMMALKDRWGLTTEEDVQKRLEAASTDDFVTLLWACCRSNHPDLDEAAVLELLDEAGLEGMVAAMEDVMAAAAPPRPEGERPQPAARAVGAA